MGSRLKNIIIGSLDRIFKATCCSEGGEVKDDPDRGYESINLILIYRKSISSKSKNYLRSLIELHHTKGTYLSTSSSRTMKLFQNRKTLKNIIIIYFDKSFFSYNDLYIFNNIND